LAGREWFVLAAPLAINSLALSAVQNAALAQATT
jgi:hypothetical protein